MFFVSMSYNIFPKNVLKLYFNVYSQFLVWYLTNYRKQLKNSILFYEFKNYQKIVAFAIQVFMNRFRYWALTIVNRFFCDKNHNIAVFFLSISQYIKLISILSLEWNSFELKVCAPVSEKRNRVNSMCTPTKWERVCLALNQALLTSSFEFVILLLYSSPYN